MAESLGWMIAQTFSLASSEVWKTTDDRGSMQSRTLAAGYYRTTLAAVAGAGTETDPKELLAAVMTALGSTRWSVILNPQGLVEITYTGSGSGSVDTSTSPTLRALLGFTSNTGTLASGSTATGAYPPSHAVFAIACDPDSGWIDGPARFAGAQMPDGSVYGWHDGRASWLRRATLRLLPRDWTARNALGASGTPTFGATSRRLSPATGEPAQALPWSVADMLGTAYARQLGVTWGQLQEILNGSVTTFDKVYLSPEMAQGGRVSLSVPGYDARRDVALELTYAGEGAR